MIKNRCFARIKEYIHKWWFVLKLYIYEWVENININKVIGVVFNAGINLYFPKYHYETSHIWTWLLLHITFYQYVWHCTVSLVLLLCLLFPHLSSWRRAQREQNIRLKNLVWSKAHLFVNIMHNKYNLLR